LPCGRLAGHGCAWRQQAAERKGQGDAEYERVWAQPRHARALSARVPLEPPRPLGTPIIQTLHRGSGVSPVQLLLLDASRGILPYAV
jgi:hypothetical protein